MYENGWSYMVKSAPIGIHHHQLNSMVSGTKILATPVVSHILPASSCAGFLKNNDIGVGG